MTAITEGFVPFRGYRTAYRIVNDSPAVKGRTPLLMVHGGPGYPWWRPRDEELTLMAAGNRPIVLYDQLGCGRSDRPDDASLWTVDLFLHELASVREQLHLERLHLYGWSWGGMLVLAYLLTRPEGVQGVVLASALHSVPLYVREARRLAAELPKYDQTTMRRFEEGYEAREPQAAERRPAKERPAKPALVITGRYDAVTPLQAGLQCAKLPQAARVVLETSAHTGILEEAQRHWSEVFAFLGRVDATAIPKVAERDGP